VPIELPSEVGVVNVGLGLLADAVRSQGRPVVQVDWRIPGGGDAETVAMLRRLFGPRAAAVDAANARSGPSIASSVVDQVPYGAELEIVGQSADWFQVKLPDQRVAWVAAGWIVTSGR